MALYPAGLVLTSFGISNLRRLTNIEPVELKPVTILVGRNSSGKSTFLRSLALIRQSVLTRTSSPILWFGGLVDFGSYETSVRDNNRKNDIGFSFGADKIPADPFEAMFGSSDDSDYYNNVVYKATLSSPSNAVYISKIYLGIRDPIIDISADFDPEGRMVDISINDENASELIEKARVSLSIGSLFPELSLQKEVARETPEPFIYRRPYDTMIYEPLAVFLRAHLHKRTSSDALTSLAIRILGVGPLAREQMLSHVTAFGPPTWKAFIREVLTSDKRKLRGKFYRLVWAGSFPLIFNVIASHFRTVFSDTLYIGPMRAKSERYYRYQDLSVSEIDPDGQNFPMFMNSLNPAQIRDFSRWTESLFGYGVRVSRDDTGHISLNLMVGGISANLVDVGYGVSQVLPVLAQIWWARTRPSRDSDDTNIVVAPLLAIEQPELHLHPAHQALLADAIVGQAKDKADRQLTFLVETHSETLVNRLGELIFKGEIAASDVQILLFEPDDNTRKTSVRVARFDEKGALMNWPYGFFQASKDFS